MMIAHQRIRWVLDNVFNAVHRPFPKTAASRKLPYHECCTQGDFETIMEGLEVASELWQRLRFSCLPRSLTESPLWLDENLWRGLFCTSKARFSASAAPG